MKENLLIALSKGFSVDTINLCKSISQSNSILLNQLLRSATSVGANIHEANYASSRADFISKFQIALKECYESEYWLDIFKESNIITDVQYSDMHEKCCKIRRLLITSINTAKKKRDSE